LEILKNFSLKHLNTFGIDAKAAEFCVVTSLSDLNSLWENRYFEKNHLILGGGSNVLLKNDFDGLVVHIDFPGLETSTQSSETFITAGAGIVWNDLVLHAVEQNLGGVENLRLIPGKVGAAPIQNIGAYGVELKDVFHSLKAYNLTNGQEEEFDLEKCQFGYRESVFKGKSKGKYVITGVVLKLMTNPTVNTSYGAIENELEKRKIHNPTIKDISDVVADIRVSKLPDPITIGNGGSFFKNPIVTKSERDRVIAKFPDLVSYEVKGGYKLAAGWLIEQCGWKGKHVGKTGTWKNQALVLVNHGGATGNEIFNFSSDIIASVESKFGVRLEREINVIG
jgi:UDP-N-acetylmuramate dehydrogenase